MKIYKFEQSGVKYIQVRDGEKIIAQWSAYTETGIKRREEIAKELYPNAKLEF